MGLEDRQNTIGPINPATLIGKPNVIVEPRAVDAMSQALRSGFITADDILSRTGDVGKTKEKAELMSLNESMSPDAQAARAAQTKLSGAQANASLPLVEPTGALQLTMLEEQQAIQKYGPGIEYFKAFAPEAGVSAPVTPDGKPDYAKRAEIGLQLFQWKQKQTQAKERLVPVHWEKSPDGSQLFKFNKGGEMITPEFEQQLSRDAIGTFAGIQPGAAAPAPSAQPAATAAAIPAITDQQRAQLVERGGMAPTQATNATSADLSRLVEPIAPATPSGPPAIEPKRVPGAAAFLGAPKATKLLDPSKIQEEVLMLKGDLTDIDNARQILKSTRNVVGPGAGSLPVSTFTQFAAAFGLREQEYQDQTELIMLINRKVVDASERMKGSLSNQDIQFLKNSVPQLTSSEGTWSNFLNKWETMTKQLVEIKSKQTGVSGGQTPPNSAPSNVAPETPPVTLSTGRKVVRGKDGQFYEVR